MVEDLWRFATALTGHRLLDAKHTRLVTTGQSNAGWIGRSTGYGFFERTIYGVRAFGHGGGAPGMNGELAVYPESGYVIAVLANIDPPVAEHVCAFSCERLPVAPA